MIKEKFNSINKNKNEGNVKEEILLKNENNLEEKE